MKQILTFNQEERLSIEDFVKKFTLEVENFDKNPQQSSKFNLDSFSDKPEIKAKGKKIEVTTLMAVVLTKVCVFRAVRFSSNLLEYILFVVVPRPSSSSSKTQA